MAPRSTTRAHETVSALRPADRAAPADPPARRPAQEPCAVTELALDAQEPVELRDALRP
jgi:hypothetical protein